MYEKLCKGTYNYRSDDGEYPTKPDLYCINKFCDETNIEESKIITVGDTMTDALFAKDSGVKFVGVAKKQNNRIK